MQPAEDIRSFIASNFYVPVPGDLHEDASLLDSGIIDSTGVLEVVAFLEEQFGIQVADEEMLPDNLDSIAKIVQYLDRKQKA